MPLQQTSGNLTSDAYGGGVAVTPVYIEQIFSTYLYTGNSPSTQTITNGIDLSGKGGMVWVKSRVSGDGSNYNNILMDTARGTGSGNILYSNLTSAAQTAPNAGISSFNSNGFSLRYDDGYGTNYPSGGTFASWTFRKQPKFFDVVTFTGGGSNIFNHSLGSVPGCVIIKCTNLSDTWWVVHRGANGYSRLNDTLANSGTGTPGIATSGSWCNCTSTTFDASNFATAGNQFVAYLFAHNAGGFGLTGTDNVISCGSFTTDGSGNVAEQNLGFEPQWILYKSSDSTYGWAVVDNMRGWPVSNGCARLYANSSSAETANVNELLPTATGFKSYSGGAFAPGVTFVYIAIRRGPMKVPTDATKVFAPLTWTGNNVTNVHTTGFPVDMTIVQNRQGTGANPQLFDRLRGMVSSSTNPNAVVLFPNSTSAEFSGYSAASDSNTAWISYSGNSGNVSGVTFADWAFQRAPSFFDEVCYTGDGTADSRTFTHNLGVTPQLVMVKRRSSTSDWVVTFNTSHAVLLNSTNADIGYNDATGNYANGILVGTNATTLTQYSGASGNSACNASGSTYVAYLFATCAGVSKILAFTGNGTTQTLNCGFTSGARFVLLKATSTTGNWMCFDTARGMTTLVDPFLSLNSTAAESATLGACTTTSVGFTVNESILAGVNTSGVSYIAMAIA